MEQHKIDRINELAGKHKGEGRTEEERADREAHRGEYADAVLGSPRRHLDNTYVVDHKGNKTKLKRKEGKE